jgi:transposase
LTRKIRRHTNRERTFPRLKEFRRIFTRYDKLDIMFSAFVRLALVCIISFV